MKWFQPLSLIFLLLITPQFTVAGETILVLGDNPSYPAWENKFSHATSFPETRTIRKLPGDYDVNY